VLLCKVFSFLSFGQLLIARLVSLRWSKVGERLDLYQNMNMQDFMLYSKIIPIQAVRKFIYQLGINEQELRALRTCCQEIRLSLVDIIPPLESTLTPISTNSEVSRDVEQHEREKRLMELKKIWMDEFIPLMEKEKRKPFPTKRLYNICIQGIPSSLRGRVWPIFIGNELRISNELYSILLGRADRAKRVSQSQSLGREGSVQLIQLDLSRTFPMLSIFQKSGPYHQSLANVLEAYTCYRPDVGYVQGMSYIAAMLLLNLNEYEAFVAFANLLNNPCYMAFFFSNESWRN